MEEGPAGARPERSAATIHYQQAGVRDRAHDRYTRLLPLLRSPCMPAEVRQSLHARIVTRR